MGRTAGSRAAASQAQMQRTAEPPVVALALASQSVSRHRGRWIYCGQDYLDMLRWEDRLGASTRISYAHLISETFLGLRGRFIEWTSELGRPHGSALEWWITPLASRNTMQTPIFLHLCYLHMLLGSLRGELEKGCLIVCEDWFLLRTIEQNLGAEGFRVNRVGLWRLALCRAFGVRVVKIIARWIIALAGQLLALIAARWTAPVAERRPEPVTGERQVLIHTCVDEGCLGSDGVFRDRFFASLSDWLTCKGYRVATIPWLYNIERSIFSAYRWFRTNRSSFLIIDDYARLSDLPGCALRILRSALIRHSDSRFGGYQIAPLLTRERVRHLASANLIRFLLYEQALSRWFRAGNRCDVFIDMFENMACERPQLKVVRQHQPAALCVGYQHAPVPNELIGYSVTAREWSTGIFPCRVVTHGRRSAEFLVKEGFPRANVVEGPALRYTYLLEESERDPQSQAAPQPARRVLVLLPLELPSAVELLIRMLGVKDVLASERVEVILKVHPMMSVGRLIAGARAGKLPDRWRWISGGIREALGQATVAIGVGTGAVLEAAAFEVPVICVGRELGLAYNPLDTFAEQFEICRTVPPDGLAARLIDILRETDPVSRFRLREFSREVLNGFGAPDDAHFSAFV